ncbi:hypothetical protein IFU08_09745 [Microbacterium sp. CFBP 8790]|uniref:hypothetical protein n=1 Tax=unclassified Microbacterium TaxID=2609290 RepID=UPI001781E016|nr:MULTISPECIES: hypothetical protein [unclassified Microbacterium]MBD8205098.1 hypothetical protein [Microbacterium sp. CFBP 8801]MBD8509847.1 hypothetical protein [Microbacterium sp. CFBP 8790]
MGWKEFAASVIGDVLSWPVVFLVVILLLLKPLRRLIGRLRSFKGWGAEMNLAEDLLTISTRTEERLEAAEPNGASNAGTRDGTTVPLRSTRRDDGGRKPDSKDKHPQSGGEASEEVAFYDTEAGAEIDPVGAIIFSWSDLLHSLVMLDIASLGPNRPASGERNILKELERAELLDEGLITSIRGLQKVRNLVAHGQVVPSPAEALSYRRTARKLANRADMLTGQLTAKSKPSGHLDP